MIALGLFVFDLTTAPPQEIQHQAAWRHPGAARVGLRPAHQYLGPDDELLNLSGVLYPEITGGEVTLDELKQMGDQGKAWPLLTADGYLQGLFVIESLEATRSLFWPDGSARRIEFRLALKRVDDDRVDLIGKATA
ncbi:tail assembly protein [Chitinimonas prasina]|uniref:Tail assembly protein n=1 Tax=Chitinimonas prasina TaxID=1434937 RepID=A0ABQ5YH63_9NEIS|nr:phage tail protein [Chitinimonas prasina]GLR13279.1 tail assembly protein [Chitinimonas prasina]